MNKKIFFTFIVFCFFAVFSGSVFAQSWLSQLNLSYSGDNSRKIKLLNFDRNKSNISSIQAEKAMSGFFSDITPSGSYSIRLDREYVGQAPGSDILL
jgi:hypothetical protein